MRTVGWLVSPRFDGLAFVLPAVVALALVPLGPWLAPEGETTVPMWVASVLLVDVAHVWSTIWRTYLDPRELRRRPALYVGAPLAAWSLGVLLHLESRATFWTVLAYVAVFHFVRQQYGWMRLYGRRQAGLTRLDRWIDGAAIYAATLYPILWWHARLPRGFEWFVKGDFLSGLVPAGLVTALGPVYALCLGVFFARQLERAVRTGDLALGKLLLVLTTALCWGIGIMVTNTDWAFTVTNVLIHGVPYVAILWVYGRRATHPEGSLLARVFGGGRWLVFYGVVVALAWVEELGWDRLIWHEHPALFPGPELELSRTVEALIVPLLALPQATHYLLDAWIWKTAPQKNPGLARTMALSE
jgi:hypothetical protein